MTNRHRATRLTVAILARDAADPLRLTLASIRAIADEILVVDSGSTDSTREVAREFGAVQLDHTWDDDFAAARNAGQSRATGDWILWLDTGETLADADAAALRKFVDTDADRQYAYVMLIRVAAADCQGAEEQIGQVRLLPNRSSILFAGRVRETPAGSLAAAGMTLAGAPFLIRRGGREHDPRLKKKRAQRNLRLAERAISEAGPTARLWNCLGEALQCLGDDTRAVECFQQSLTLSPRGTPEMLEAYYGLWTSTPVGDEWQTSLGIQALEVFPLDAQLLCALGGSLQTQGKLPLATQCYANAYKYGQVQPLVWHVTEIRDLAAVGYSTLLHLQQRGPEATQFLETAVRERPAATRLRRRLIEDYVAAGEPEPAAAHARELDQATPHSEALRTAVRGACYAAQHNWTAARAYLDTAYRRGCRDPLCLKWLALSLLGSGEVATARPILEQWQTAEPRNPQPPQLLAGTAPLPPAVLSNSDRRVRMDAPETVPQPGPGLSPGLPYVLPLPATPWSGNRTTT